MFCVAYRLQLMLGSGWVGFGGGWWGTTNHTWVGGGKTQGGGTVAKTAVLPAKEARRAEQHRHMLQLAKLGVQQECNNGE